MGLTVFMTVYFILLLLYLYPHWPVTAVGWALMLLVGIPVSVVLELLGNAMFLKRRGEGVSREGFSGKRIAVALLLIVGVVVLLGGFAYYFGDHIRRHFN
jgi:hypothetical protein